MEISLLEAAWRKKNIICESYVILSQAALHEFEKVTFEK